MAERFIVIGGSLFFSFGAFYFCRQSSSYYDTLRWTAFLRIRNSFLCWLFISQAIKARKGVNSGRLVYVAPQDEHKITVLGLLSHLIVDSLAVPLAFAALSHKGGSVRKSPGVPSPEARQRPARSVRLLWRCCLYPAFPLSPKRDRQYTSCPRCPASRSSVRGWNGQEAAHRAALRYATSPFSAENRDRAENGAIWCRL